MTLNQKMLLMLAATRHMVKKRFPHIDEDEVIWVVLDHIPDALKPLIEDALIDVIKNRLAELAEQHDRK